MPPLSRIAWVSGLQPAACRASSILDGRLFAARQMGPQFDKSQFALRRIHCETIVENGNCWCGKTIASVITAPVTTRS